MATPFKFKNADGTTVDFEDYYVRADYFRSGNLWVCGFNNNGQLGDNTSVTKRSSPVQTIAFGNNWKQVSSGDYHTAAIKTDGTLWLWGANYYGSIGDNTLTKRSSPVQTVAFGTNWMQVSAGYKRTAAIKTDGTLWIWGRGNLGQLGDNTIISKSSPVQTVAFGTNWKQVACGYRHTAAVKTDGTLWCWGDNANGQLGDNTVTKRSSPVQTVAFGTNWISVSCGREYAAAIKTDGTLWCWGDNANGQLGDNTTTKRSSPVQTISYGNNWKQVSSGNDHTAAIKTDGTLWVWGMNFFSPLGDGTMTNRSSPIQTITLGTNWKQVACGMYCTAAVKTDGTLWAWGYNSYGNIADNTITTRSSPVQTIMYGTNWKQVSVGWYFNAAAVQYQDDYQ